MGQLSIRGLHSEFEKRKATYFIDIPCTSLFSKNQNPILDNIKETPFSTNNNIKQGREIDHDNELRKGREASGW